MEYRGVLTQCRKLWKERRREAKKNTMRKFKRQHRVGREKSQEIVDDDVLATRKRSLVEGGI
jgi:hypothetical protein